MSRLYLAFLLDLFQSCHPKHDLIREIAAECYRPLEELFNSHWNARFTVSLSNSLAESLIEYGESEVIERLREAIGSGHVELIHTADCHSILPLMPEQEVRRQIELDIKFKEEHFGLTARSGILSPEMCYDDRLIPVFQDLGFRWTMIDDRVMGMYGIEIPDRAILHVGRFAVLMRSALWSGKILQSVGSGGYLSGREFIEQLEQEAASCPEDRYRIVAISGETFGHHIKYFEETFLRDMLFALERSDSVRLCCVSDLLQVGSLQQVQKQRDVGRDFEYFPLSSWATQPEDCQRGDPFPHWKSQGNRVQELLWKLTELILDSCQEIDFANPANKELRRALDRAFYSSQYFWASVWFWKPNLMYEGIDLQMRALYRCARLKSNKHLLNEGQRIYIELMWETYNRIAPEG